MDLAREGTGAASLTLRLVPTGEEQNAANVNAIPNHRREFKSGKRPSISVELHKQSHGWRTQFSIAYHFSVTVYRAIGVTAHMVASQPNCYNRKYCMWEREHLLILLRRSSNGLTVVTTDVRCYKERLRQNSPWVRHIEMVLYVLVDRVVRPRLFAHALPEANLPDGNVACVYMLVSTKVPSYFYVGETNNIKRRRLGEHNRGRGARKNRDVYLRP